MPQIAVRRLNILSESVYIDGNSLSLEDIAKVSRNVGITVVVKPEASKKVERCRQFIESILRTPDAVVYGINTGFGPLSRKRVSDRDLRALQKNLILSHSTGVGKPLPEEFVRAMMLLRANMLAKGLSGIRNEVLERLVKMLNKGVHPVIPEKGSVTASGDLAPLSHLVLVMIGSEDAEAVYNGQEMRSAEAMAAAEIEPVKLEPKEGLALNNGTSAATGIAALAVHDATVLLKIADIAGAMSLEALLGVRKAFDERVQKARGHLGQIESARNIRELLNHSQLCREESNEKISDAYSLRCIPQVHGAVRDAFRYVKTAIETEANAATDDPLFFVEGDVICCGNFHGQPVSIAMDTAAVALSTLGNISERRIARLTDQSSHKIKKPTYQVELPDFLIEEEKLGLNSGFMVAQFTAAALASENKVLSHPASVDTIPTCANFEDHVSMGMHAARKAYEVKSNVEYILAIELLCAAQAIDILGAQGIDSYGPRGMGRGTSPAYRLIRENVPYLKDDRVLSKDIERITELIRSEQLMSIVESGIGTLS